MDELIQRRTGEDEDVAEALAAWAERVRRRQLDRLGGGAALESTDRALLDTVSLRLVDALVGPAVHRLRRASRPGDTALADAARDLFGLP